LTKFKSSEKAKEEAKIKIVLARLFYNIIGKLFSNLVSLNDEYVNFYFNFDLNKDHIFFTRIVFE